MDPKTQNVVGFTILGFFMVAGVPYFYLNRFKQGFLFLFIQTMSASLVFTYMELNYMGIVTSHGYIGELNVDSAWKDLFSGELLSVPFEWFYPLIFIPAVIQATHMTYLILKKKI